MTTLAIAMTVRPSKRREMLLTLDELTTAMQQEQGFLGAKISINPDDRCQLVFLEEWNDPGAVDLHMQSSLYFTVMQGALKLLTSSSSIEIFKGRRKQFFSSGADSQTRLNETGSEERAMGA